MEKQNVTLSLPKDILQKAKILSIKRETSLSGLLTEVLTEIVNQSDRYEIAKKNHLALLEKGVNFGSNGQATWTRDDLHERDT